MENAVWIEIHLQLSFNLNSLKAPRTSGRFFCYTFGAIQTPLALGFKGISLLFSIDGIDLPSLCFLKDCGKTMVYLSSIGEVLYHDL